MLGRPTDTKIIDGSVDKVTTWLQATTLNELAFVFQNNNLFHLSFCLVTFMSATVILCSK